MRIEANLKQNGLDLPPDEHSANMDILHDDSTPGEGLAEISPPKVPTPEITAAQPGVDLLGVTPPRVHTPETTATQSDHPPALAVDDTLTTPPAKVIPHLMRNNLANPVETTHSVIPTTLKTLKPYIPTNTSRRQRRHVYREAQDVLNTMFEPARWPKYFKVENRPHDDIDLQTYLRHEVGPVEMYHHTETTRIVEVHSEEQSSTMKSLLDTQSDSLMGNADESLNRSVGTVVVPSSVILKDDFKEVGPRLCQALQLDFPALQKVETYTIQTKRGMTRDLPPLRIAKLFFDYHELPSSIKIGAESLHVKPYTRRPIQCTNCWKYGHPAKYCRSERHCSLCGVNTKHNEHPNPCLATTPCCVNCGDKHAAHDKTCSHYAFAREALHLMSTKGIPFKAATRLLRESGQAPKRRYAAAARPPPSIAPTASPHIQPTLHVISTSQATKSQRPIAPSPVPTSNAYAILGTEVETTQPLDNADRDTHVQHRPHIIRPKPQAKLTNTLKSHTTLTARDAGKNRLTKLGKNRPPSGIPRPSISSGKVGEKRPPKTIVDVKQPLDEIEKAVAAFDSSTPSKDTWSLPDHSESCGCHNCGK